MKKITVTLIGISTTFLSITPSVLATSTVNISNNGEGGTSTVNVQTNTGNNTICVNGKCTVSAGENGKSTVCINGKCTTSEGGIKAESEDGTAKVNVESNNSSVNIEQKSNNRTSVNINQDALGASTEGSEDVDKKKKIEEARKKAKEKLEKARLEAEKAKKERFDFSDFMEKKLEFLRKIVTFQFLFGDK